MSKTPESDDEIENKSWWTRFKDSLSQIKNTISDKIDNVTNSPTFQKFKNSPVVRTISDIATAATAGSPIASIILYSATIAGLVLPVTAPVAITIGAIGIAGVAIGAIMDTIHTRNLRKAQKENNLLVNFRKAKNDQDIITSQDPELLKILDIDKKDQQDVKKTEFTKSSPGFIKAKAIGKAVLRYASDLIVGITQGLITSGLSLARQIATTAIFVAIEGKERIRADQYQRSYGSRKQTAYSNNGFTTFNRRPRL
jgi:hypothetical protein